MSRLWVLAPSTHKESSMNRSAHLSGRVRTGLVLCILLGAANIPFLFDPTKPGHDGPPYSVLVLDAVLGVISIVAAIAFWRTGRRAANRLAAGTLIINAVTTLPAFFANVGDGIKIAAAGVVLLSLGAVVLMLGRENTARSVVPARSAVGSQPSPE